MIREREQRREEARRGKKREGRGEIKERKEQKLDGTREMERKQKKEAYLFI